MSRLFSSITYLHKHSPNTCLVASSLLKECATSSLPAIISSLALFVRGLRLSAEFSDFNLQKIQLAKFMSLKDAKAELRVVMSNSWFLQKWTAAPHAVTVPMRSHCPLYRTLKKTQGTLVDVSGNLHFYRYRSYLQNCLQHCVTVIINWACRGQ